MDDVREGASAAHHSPCPEGQPSRALVARHDELKGQEPLG
jgi:hypothetical protein